MSEVFLQQNMHTIYTVTYTLQSMAIRSRRFRSPNSATTVAEKVTTDKCPSAECINDQS